MKILTNIRFAQTAGIAQVVLSFMDFIKKSGAGDLSITAVNIINKRGKNTFKKKMDIKNSTISASLNVPNIAKVIKKAKGLSYVEKRYSKVISAYQRAIKEEKPDLILVNGTYFLPWCLLLAAQKEGVPVVLHYHGVLAKETASWNKKAKKIFLDMEKCFDNDNTFYIFPSDMTKNVVEKEVFGHKIYKSAIIPNPVPEYFVAGKNKKTKQNIGIVSRWTRIKNVQFCEKLAKYNQKNGNKFTINIITDLDSKNKNYKRMSKLVTFYSSRSNKKLVAFYQKMGVVISPSHFETYGNVAKEAVASGTPAIINHNMGVSETFKKLGLHDWIINFDSVKSVYKKIEDVIGGEVAEDVKNQIKESYGTHKIFAELVSVLSNAI